MKTEYLLNKELEHVLAALMPVNSLVVRVMLHTGLRVGDVLNLKTEQLNYKFWITEQKTKKRRQIGLTRPLLRDLQAISGKIYVFEGRNDPKKHRTRQAVWKDIKRAQKLFRLPENAGTHTMRKIYAVDLMQKYGNLSRVQRALNHSSPEVTLIYAMADKLLQDRQHHKLPQRGRK